MATSYVDLISNGSTLRINYSYTQNAIANTTTVTVTSIMFRAGSIYGWYYADGVLTIGGSSLTYYNNASSGAYCTNAGEFYELGSQYNLPTFTVNHDSVGKGSFYISVAPRAGTGYNDFNIFCARSTAGNYALVRQSIPVALPQIDRTAPSVTLTASATSTSSISLSASASVSCDLWQYKIDDGSWTDFSTTASTSANTTVTGLSSASHTVQVRARKATNYVYGSSDSVTVDCVAPAVTFTVTGISVNDFSFSASASVSCDLWQYKIDDGSWTDFSTTAGTSASTVVTGLDPNTTYAVQVRARKASNYIYGSATEQNVKTLGPSQLNSAAGFAIDVAAPSAQINVTVYETFSHKLHFYAADGTTLITTKTVGSMAACTDTDKVIALTATNRTALLNQCPTAKTLTVKIVLETFTDSSYSESIGLSAMREITLSTSAAESAPLFTTVAYRDSESAVAAVTGDDQILVQNLSHLLVTATAGTARNGASVTGYSVSIGDVSLTSTGTTLDVGSIASAGELTLSVTCSDSRGYSTTVAQTITVLAYSSPRLTSYSLRRQNEIGALVQLAFSGSISSINVGNDEKNAVATATVKYKKTSESSWTTINLMSGITISGLAFSYSNLELITLDADYSFDFCLTITDNFGALTQLDYPDILNQGTPLLAFRKRFGAKPPRVGINNPSPNHALDVHGNIAMNDILVQGWIAELGDDYLSSFVNGGIFTQSDAGRATTVKGYPTAKAGVLEVLVNQSGHVMQRYTPYDAPVVYVRSYTGVTWSNWILIENIPKPHNYAFDGANLLDRFGSMEAIHQAVAAADFTRIFVGDYIPVTVSGLLGDRDRWEVPIGTQLYGDEDLTIPSQVLDHTETIPWYSTDSSFTFFWIDNVGYGSCNDLVVPTFSINENHLMEVAAINPYIHAGPTELTTNHLIMCSRDCIGTKVRMGRDDGSKFYTPGATDPYTGSPLYQLLNGDQNSLRSILLQTDIGPYIYTGPNGNGMECWWATTSPGQTVAPSAGANKGRGVIFLPTETECFGAQFFMHDRYSIGSLLVQWELFKNSMCHLVKKLGPNAATTTQWWTSTFIDYKTYAANTPTGNLGSRNGGNQNTGLPICFMFV